MQGYARGSVEPVRDKVRGEVHQPHTDVLQGTELQRAEPGALEKCTTFSRTPGVPCLVLLTRAGSGTCTIPFPDLAWVSATSRGPASGRCPASPRWMHITSLSQGGGGEATTFYWGQSTCQALCQTLSIHYFLSSAQSPARWVLPLVPASPRRRG